MDVGFEALLSGSRLVRREEKKYLTGLIEHVHILQDNWNDGTAVTYKRILGHADPYAQQVHRVAFVQPLDRILKFGSSGKFVGHFGSNPR
jgi:hypothetical protein